MSRLNKVSLVLGNRGTGKTYFTRELISKYRASHSLQKILIMDTLDHPSYSDIAPIESNMLSRWSGGGTYRIFKGNPDVNLDAIQRNLKNALIVFEDAGKYIRKNLQLDVRQFVIDSKQKNLDLIFIFHGFAATPPELIRYSDIITMFRTDNPEYRKSEIYVYDEIKKNYEQILKSKNPYEKRTIIIS